VGGQEVAAGLAGKATKPRQGLENNRSSIRPNAL